MPTSNRLNTPAYYPQSSPTQSRERLLPFNESTASLPGYQNDRPAVQANFIPNSRQAEAIGRVNGGPSADSALASRNERPEFAAPAYGNRHASLTPSMSASNVGSGSDEGHHQTGARIFEHLQAGDEKLLTSQEKYDLHPSIFKYNGPEDDDALHDPGEPAPRNGPDRRVVDSKKIKSSGHISALGMLNIFGLLIIALALLGVFAGLPITEYFTKQVLASANPFGYGGANSTGQMPTMSMDLIDKDTPVDRRTWQNADGDDYVLVFSDEFNVDGRTFYTGEDPYWEAVNLHYHGTNDLEMYKPEQAVTEGGNLVITMNRTDPETNGDLGYVSAMLQTWNKFCFRGGYIEVNVSLPGNDQVPGFWPAAWTMGNLGRAGYGATTDGTWPYSYEACDVGTLHNQTNFGSTTEPAAAVQDGDPSHGDMLSFLPGQRLSACTCPGEDHPGPKTSDGKFLGRSAPEIDIIEAMTEREIGGTLSQSFQVAPFNANYTLMDPPGGATYNIDGKFGTVVNAYKGGVFQQAASGLSAIPSRAYDGGFLTYGFDYAPSDTGNGWITWYLDNSQTWKITDGALEADPLTQIAKRPVSNEPMYIILNFGMSNNFGIVDQRNLVFPSSYLVDYVRVYQKSGSVDYGCDGKSGDYPTTQYIQEHVEIYNNRNMTLWSDAGLTFPKNELQGGC